MQRRFALLAVTVTLIASLGAAAMAQWGGGRSRRNVDSNDRKGVPEWPVNPDFKHDLFTFVRIQYDDGGGWGRRRRGGSWETDYPDSDLNFSYRLQELTALKTDPHPKVLRLTDETLFDYPFLYLIEPGDMYLSDEEVTALRRYLFNGGFMMVDDFWGVDEWENFYGELRRVFPDREPERLTLDHEVFHCVYDLNEMPQIPSIHAWYDGRVSERRDAPEAYYWGVYDDKRRMMMIICHNTDLGDGWEREGENAEYFREFSEKRSYPLGINIVVYAMTH
jgi:hypothetical protein